MRSKRKWRAPNNPTVQARILWRAIYHEPWPKGWRVEWAGFMRNTYGLTLWRSRRIVLSYADARRPKPDRFGGTAGVLHVLVHEFTHLRFPGMKHGKEFTRLVEWGWNKLQEASL